MFPYTDISHELRGSVVDKNLYDLYRLVDIHTHTVWEYSEGDAEPVNTGETCHHIWGINSPCANCTSNTCLARQEGIMKIESLDGRLLLIYSTPVVVCGRAFALELIKDVTSSLVVPSAEKRDNIEIVEMVEHFNELAVRDTFTGLFSKSYVLNQLQVDMDHSLECEKSDEHEPVAFVMFDLDLFKEVNDKFGHNIGDEALLHLARCIDGCTAEFEGSWAGRFGGDEFVMCCPLGITPEQEKHLVELQNKVAERTFNYPQGSFNLSLSYGIARMQEGDDARTLIDRADKAMYEMKAEHHAMRK